METVDTIGGAHPLLATGEHAVFYVKTTDGSDRTHSCVVHVCHTSGVATM